MKAFVLSAVLTTTTSQLAACYDRDAGEHFSSTGGAAASADCSLFGVPLEPSRQWLYAVRSKGHDKALESIQVSRVEGGIAEIETTVTLKEERVHWSATVECSSRRILTQAKPALAYVLWPFPGVFAGQIIDEATLGTTRWDLPSGHGDGSRAVSLRYRQVGPDAGGRSHIIRENERGGVADIEIDARQGALSVRFNPDSSIELIGEGRAEEIRQGLEAEDEADEHHGFSLSDRLVSFFSSSNAAVATGATDYTGFCNSVYDATIYNDHWPEIAFGTRSGVVNAGGSFLTDNDLTWVHDDRDTEFDFVPDDPAFAATLQLGQSAVATEWESLMLFPKHPQWIWDHPDAEPFSSPDYPSGAHVHVGNHFLSLRDIAYQSPRAGDRVFMRGSVIVDCGHAPAVEIHPPQALFWRHTFGPPGIADYYFRASAYGWYPHVDNFTGPLGDQGSFEADLDIPDAITADPGSTATVGAIVPVVDYTYAGYSLSDDISTSDVYDIDHPMAHLFGGDPNQPMSSYFDVSIIQNGSKVHVHAMPKFPWNVATDSPQRPALIGFHFMACLPQHDSNHVDLNGCIGSGALDLPNEYIGQTKPVNLGGVLNGWFYDRHRPLDPLTIEIRGFTDTCDRGHTEILLATVTTTYPAHSFSYQLPNAAIHICTPTSPGTPADEPLDGIILRTYARDDRPEPASTDIYSYRLPNTCVTTPETVAVGGLCPAGTGYGGTGYLFCGPNGTILEPYCVPGLAGEPVLPAVPVGLTATPGPNQVTLAWQAVSGAIGYNAYTVAGSVFTKVAFTFAPSVTLTGLPNGSVQVYSVTAVNSIGESARSAGVSGSSLHCSQVCGGCCTGEVCSSTSASNGCVSNGAACAAACPATTDTCIAGSCSCHQSDTTVCFGAINTNTEFNRTCGNFTNACGGTVNCGTCPQFYTCTGGGQAHCVCTTPVAQSTACAGICGSAADGCGGTYACSCPTGSSCQSGRCVAPPPPLCKNCVTP